MIFLSETQAFQHDLRILMKPFEDEYCFDLNSDDRHDPELGIVHNKAYGGTMILWSRKLDPFVTIHPVNTSSFLPLILHPPGNTVSIHIALYLPTSGKDTEFIEEITKLKICIEELSDKYPKSVLFLRGDSNVNMNNKHRAAIFKQFLFSHNLKNVPIDHKTYHHFIGNGLFDSNVDVILQSASCPTLEKVVKIHCQSESPLINSHHDAIISTVEVPFDIIEASENGISAPIIPNTRKKILWSDENLINYKQEISDKLLKLRSRWSNTDSVSSMSILFQMTYETLNSAAVTTNKSVNLGDPPNEKRSSGVPLQIRKSQKKLQSLRLSWKMALQKKSPHISEIKANLDKEGLAHRRLVRQFKHHKASTRDKSLYPVLTSEPFSVFRTIKSSKSRSTTKLPFLTVGSEEFVGDRVSDGFFSSISALKTQNISKLESSPHHTDLVEDYQLIMDLCKDGNPLPKISLVESNKILRSMKTRVNDFYGISPLHYLNAGDEGLVHFNFLMNAVIANVSNASIEEMNTAYALLLHKGHGKVKTSDRSYRTISTCPTVSKGLDIYIRDLHKSNWNSVQAAAQYQGDGSSHELAALMVTEVIQHSIQVKKEPIFLLFLDARSAFDAVVLQYLIRNMFFAGMDGQALMYANHRLMHRQTFLDWNKTIMGPIHDQQGVEQGGVNSSDYYKMYNNELHNIAANSKQGVKLGDNLVISSVGLADDTALCANRITNLSNILYLVLKYCEKYNVSLCSDKTKLLMFGSPQQKFTTAYNPIQINGHKIEFSQAAEHVGIIRSVDGNLAHIMERIKSHKRAIGGNLSVGLARSHRANPAASLRIERMYATPVLLSGVPCLVLTKADTNLLNQHYKNILQNLQKLPSLTPHSVTYFLAGSLPLTAQLHIRQLGLFSMICRLADDPLNYHARNVLTTSKRSSKSWFWQIRDLCLQYSLPHPLHFLECPPNKEHFRKLVNSRITNYWEVQLRLEASLLPSLLNFHPQFMSLAKPHPLWLSAGANPYEVSKAIQQAKFLSGRYRTESLCSHWSSNKGGFCLSPTCSNQIESVEHILVHCQAYAPIRDKLRRLWHSSSNPTVLELASQALVSSSSYLLQFILDCSVIPHVITATQHYGTDLLYSLFHLTRTWCFAIHRERMKIYGRWNFS